VPRLAGSFDEFLLSSPPRRGINNSPLGISQSALSKRGGNMPLDIQPIQRDGWTPLPMDGCRNVWVKMLMKLDHLGLALLRFDPDGTIHEHPAGIVIDVICLEGAGMVSVGGEQAPLRAGERIRWPAGIPHRLWTTDTNMLTLMVEHHESGTGR
jgi:quercetin dioxygenase-like cupin family protein